jgi:hypothetical protein
LLELVDVWPIDMTQHKNLHPLIYWSGKFTTQSFIWKLKNSTHFSSIYLYIGSAPSPYWQTFCCHDLYIYWVKIMVFNVTFNNISVISWRSILLVEETGENHRLVVNHWQTIMLYRVDINWNLHSINTDIIKIIMEKNQQFKQ